MTHLMFTNDGLRLKHAEPIGGFTLVELISVIVILSIISVIGTSFVVRTTQSYQQTQTRALIVNTARQSMERMTRQLRIALPFSLRLTNGNSCLEFMPIAAGGNYFGVVPDTASLGAASATIPASPVPTPADFGVARFVSIGAMAPGELYGASAVSRAGYASYTNGNLMLTAAKRWQRNSMNKRYFLLDNPQAFCLVGDQLRFYSGIDVANANVNLAGAFDILARGVSSVNPFVIVGGNNNRNTAVELSLTFSSSGESINFTNRVLIRNAP